MQEVLKERFRDIPDTYSSCKKYFRHGVALLVTANAQKVLAHFLQTLLIFCQSRRRKNQSIKSTRHPPAQFGRGGEHGFLFGAAGGIGIA